MIIRFFFDDNIGNMTTVERMLSKWEASLKALMAHVTLNHIRLLSIKESFNYMVCKKLTLGLDECDSKQAISTLKLTPKLNNNNWFVSVTIKWLIFSLFFCRKIDVMLVVKDRREWSFASDALCLCAYFISLRRTIKKNLFLFERREEK